MQTPQKTRWQHPATLSLLALALGSASAQAETLEGTLERGEQHSVLWFVSPESGDLIGQVFANTSQAGQVILAKCLPDMACTVEDVSTGEADEQLLKKLNFSARPSGWWHIEQAKNAYIQPSLPMNERELSTRFGRLHITDEHWLLFKGSPVLDNPAPAAVAAIAATAAPAPAPAAPTGAEPTLLTRLQTWWSSWWEKLQHKLLALLGRAPADTAAPAQEQPLPAPTAQALPAPASDGTAEVVQGNNSLHLVAHFELPDRDIVLLQVTGGTLCPALYRFATLTLQGIAVTPEFGTCSDIASIRLPDSQPGEMPEPRLSLVGFMGPFEPEAEQERASRRLYRFVLRQGKVLDLDKDSQS